MKRLLAFVLIALLVTACKKNDGDTVVTVNQYLTDNYTTDAKVILFRLLQSGAVTTDKDKPEFSPAELNRILSVFQAIYDSKTPQSDTIFNIAKMHVFGAQGLRGMILRVDPNNDEGKKAIAHQPTGNALYEALLAKYGYTYYGNSQVYPTGAFVAVRSDTLYNLLALINLFKNFSFIINAEQDGVAGDGSDITYTLSGNGADVNFAMKSGDCPAGCIIQHGWKYHVSTGYKVTYLGRY